MTVEQLKSQRRTKKDSYNTFVNRRNSVRNIVSNIDNKIDDDIRDINNQISNCINELKQGLKGTSKITQICSDMEFAKEKGVGSDSIVSSCRGNLSSEATRCQGNINTLDSEIKSLENQIRAQGGTIFPWE